MSDKVAHPCVSIACVGVMPGDNISDTVIVQIGCTGKTIVDFVSSVPIGMMKGSIQNPSTGIFVLNFFWIPIAAQYGPQGVCMGAIDNTNVQSNQWCITYLVGFKSPEVIKPTLVQGSASPIGTIFQNHTLFTIQSNHQHPHQGRSAYVLCCSVDCGEPSEP